MFVSLFFGEHIPGSVSLLLYAIPNGFEIAEVGFRPAARKLQVLVHLCKM
jgi:hypothetical protein